MKIKVSETTPIQLNWLVAKCEGIGVGYCGAGPSAYPAYTPKRSAYKLWEPTKNWAQGGPIIEREGIGHYKANSSKVWAHPYGGEYNAEGPTPLIAAMRCYVTSKLGDEVDIPEGLE